MAAGDQHRIKAAEFLARAQSEARLQFKVQLESLAKAHLRLAEQADLNERVEVIDDLCRELGSMGGAKSKKGFYETPRPGSVMQTEQVTSGISFFVILLAMAASAVLVFWASGGLVG